MSWKDAAIAAATAMEIATAGPLAPSPADLYSYRQEAINNSISELTSNPPTQPPYSDHA